ncbi:3-methyladenine DNA glycosylase [Microbacterium sulfonylureivorans]|uniref:3-methyladenine DNA glycosylase n=1 Tax=Microbacterium sulfonylureivorans TaxID=2486854 RepID=UPI003B846F19
MTIAPPCSAVLGAAEWHALEDAHASRADALTAGHRARAARGERHPVEDFLFTYYSYKPSVLRRWHPGSGVELADASGTARAEWRWYGPGDAPSSLAVDGAALRAERGALIVNIGRILRATAGRAGSFGCFGLHEWAMVYRERGHRHAAPLRLGQEATDAVVEAHDLRCTHFDAFRFFTPEAVPLNRDAPSRERQAELEQPGCLHAGMDLYKWAVKLGPLVPGDLLLDTFELARDIRTLDMRASPYDLLEWGYEPVAIETADGKADYVRAQRGFAERGQALRSRLLDAVDRG